MWVTAKLTTIGSVALGWDMSGVPAAELVSWDRLWDMSGVPAEEWVSWDRLCDTSPPVVAEEAKVSALVTALDGQVSGGAKSVPRTMILSNTVKGTLVMYA